MSTHPSSCPLDCPDACSLNVEVVDGRVHRVRGSKATDLTAGFICSKVSRMAEHLYCPERVLEPLVRTGAKGSGRFKAVSWDEALDRIARQRRRRGLAGRTRRGALRWTMAGSMFAGYVRRVLR